ncbi:NUDIX domain-containing protein [Aquimarina sp. W85]|uniref:NUDIX domain-containing protein n=1 Tax=Aquimarina rhodophyticola TaxID=3342246 RepID=UPI00367017C1
MMKPRVKNEKNRVLSSNKYTLREYSFDFLPESSEAWEHHVREVFDRGDAAAVLLFNKLNRTVILTKQFRYPVYLVNQQNSSMEVCAGMLDGDSPRQCAIREALEETGYQLSDLESLGAVFTSPGVSTEKIYLFLSEYNEAMKVTSGGGVKEEHEHINVVELSLEQAIEKVQNGSICDAKTILLLQAAQIKYTL